MALAMLSQVLTVGCTAVFADDQPPMQGVQLVSAERRPVAGAGETLPSTILQLDYSMGRVTLSGDPPPATAFGADDHLLLEITRPDGTTVRWERTFNADCFENKPIPPEDVTSLFEPGLNTARVTISDLCRGSIGSLGRVMLSGVSLAGGGTQPRSATGSSPFPVSWLVALVFLMGFAGVVAVRHRRVVTVPGGPVGTPTDVIPTRPMPVVAAGTALVAVTQAPTEKSLVDAGPFDVGIAPVTIGWGESCGIQVPEVVGVAAEHARLWLRDGRLMIHHLAPGYTTLASGTPITWASLSEGDEISIGPYTLRFVEKREAQDARGE